MLESSLQVGLRPGDKILAIGHPVHLGYLYVQDDKILFGVVFGLVNDGDGINIIITTTPK